MTTTAFEALYNAVTAMANGKRFVATDRRHIVLSSISLISLPLMINIRNDVVSAVTSQAWISILGMTPSLKVGR
ncbi:hypothetical protein Q1695_006464 [Nippostrongylus brasiliensis]|nr:hypothetical protein Q1695_006464 [Nippostrongylus brasiliensis]